MANRYWVGGTASWDGTAGTKWATTDGGAGGSSVPTSADDVFVTAKNAPTWVGSTAYILTNIVSPVTGNGYFYECTTAGTTGSTEPTWPTVVGNTVTDGTVVWTCRSATVTIATGNTGAKSIDCTGFTGTLTGSAAITIAGGLKLVAGMTYSYTGTITFTGTGTLTSAGKSFRGININGSGITTTLGDALTITLGSCTLTEGTFDTAGFNLSATTSLTATGAGTKTLNLNGSTVTISGGQGVYFELASNLTFNAGTSQINLSGSGSQIVTGSTAYTFYDVTYTSTAAGNRILNANATFRNLTITAPASNTIVNLVISQDITITSALTASATSSLKRCVIRSGAFGTARTITTATLSANDCDFRDIAIAGAAAGTAPTRAGNCEGNSGITFPAAKTVYRVGTDTTWAGVSSWATGTGGTGDDTNFPLAQDTAVINNDTALTGTLNITSYNMPAIDCSARTTGLTLNFSGIAIYGSLLLGSGITVSGSSGTSFLNRKPVNLQTAGKAITFIIVINAINGSVTLLDALSFSGTAYLQIFNGTFNADIFAVTTYFVDSTSSTSPRTITMGSGLWTLTGDNTTVWNVTATGLTINKDAAYILLSSTSTNPRVFEGAGFTYNKLTIGGATGTSTLTINGANSFSEIASTKTVAHTITFGANQGTIDIWSVTGTAGNVVTVNSSSVGTQRTFNLTNVSRNIDYLSVKDIGVNQINRYYVGANSTNGGNNTNVIFTAAPAAPTATGNMFMLFQ